MSLCGSLWVFNQLKVPFQFENSSHFCLSKMYLFLWEVGFVLLMVLGFEFWASPLLSRHFETCPCSGYFWDRVWLFAQASLVHDPPIYVSHCSWDNSALPLHPAIGWNKVSRFSCLGWPWTVILLIFTLWVARITGMRHRCPASYSFDSCPELLF
jgi:hypothetical protein